MGGMAVLPWFVQADSTRRRFVDTNPQFTVMVVASQFKGKGDAILGFHAIGVGVVGDEIATPNGFNLEKPIRRESFESHQLVPIVFGKWAIQVGDNRIHGF